jgi:DNA-binding MarR family transcriptional regulator
MVSTNHANPLIGLIDSVSRMHGRLRSAFADMHGEAGISEMEMTVLTAVVEASHPPTVPQIGRSLGHPRQVIQRAANSLIQAGIIETAPNPDHQRAALLAATDIGRSMKHAADRRAAVIADDVLQSIDPITVANLSASLDALRTQIEAYVRSQKGGSHG